eukprot:UN23987
MRIDFIDRDALIRADMNDADRDLLTQVLTLDNQSGSTSASNSVSSDAVHIEVAHHGAPKDTFWDVVRQGQTDAADDFGVKHTDRQPRTSDTAHDQIVAVQVDAMHETAWRMRDGLAISIFDEDDADFQAAITEVLDEGVPIISMNSGINHHDNLGVDLHIGQDEVLAGKEVANTMIRDLSSGSWKAVCINHEPGNVGLKERCDGFQEKMEEAGHTYIPYEINHSFDDTDSQNEIKDQVRDYVENQNVRGILALGNMVSGLVFEALEEASDADNNYNQLVDLATFDWDSNVIANIKSGAIDFAVDQQQYLQGYIPIPLLRLRSKYGLMAVGKILTGPNMITASDVPLYENRDYAIPSTALKMKQTIKIAYVIHGHRKDAFWHRVVNSIKAAGIDMGIIIEYRHPSQTDERLEKSHYMATLVDEYVAKDDIDGLVITIPLCDDTTFAESVSKALDAGIKVISINSGAGCYNDPAKFSSSDGLNMIETHIGQQEVLAGNKVGQWVTANRPAGKVFMYQTQNTK